jgi:hypothetical protein
LEYRKDGTMAKITGGDAFPRIGSIHLSLFLPTLTLALTTFRILCELCGSKMFSKAKEEK